MNGDIRYGGASLNTIVESFPHYLPFAPPNHRKPPSLRIPRTTAALASALHSITSVPGSIANAAHLTNHVNRNGNGNATSNGISPEESSGLAESAGKSATPVLSVNPDATPQQKVIETTRAILGGVPDSGIRAPPVQEHELLKDAGGLAPAIPTIMVEDTDKKVPHAGDSNKPSAAQYPVAQSPAMKAPVSESPSVEKDHAQRVSEAADEAQLMPGTMPPGPAPVIPDWYIVGWRQAAGVDKPPLPEGEERDKGILDTFLSEQFYGEWYHNAGIIIFAVLATHFLTRFHFGWGWMFIILAICNTYYTTSMTRVRRNTRDDIQRELVKTRLASEHETADWINNFLDRFWPMYEPVLSQTVIQSVNQILITSTPAFLDSLRMTQFTLGNKAPRIDKVRTFPKTDKDVVMMDWGVSFTPKDTTDMTEREKADKVNPKIELSIRVGKGLATAALPVLVEDVTFSGLMRIRMKLIPNFPHVQIVDICFLEKPVIDYVLKPIGGDMFGFDIANLPGLSSFIRDMTHATLGPMMYDPNVFTLNLEQLLSGKPLDAAIGVVQVTLYSARGITGTKIGGGTPDPYVSLSISGRAELAKTRYKSNTYNPSWNETKYLLVHSLQDVLDLQVYDYNDHRKDSLMSSATFQFSKFLEEQSFENITSSLLKDGKTRGELRYDVNYFPCIEPEEGNEELLQSTVGIVRLTIHQAKELDHSKSLTNDLNPLARVYLNNSKSSSFSTRCFKHTNTPVWEAPFEYLCTDKQNSTITIKIIDDRDFLKDPVIGYMTVKVEDLLTAKLEAGRDWFTLNGCKSGKVRISAEWKPLNMAGSLHGMDQYSPPIGVVKLLLDRAVDVKNVEATLGGKSDPYVRAQVQNVTKGRTEVINNNLNPVWDQIVYIPVHSLKENILLECMDYQNLTKDRSLGYVDLQLSELASETTEDPEHPFTSKGKKSAAEPLRQDKGGGTKGILHYTAEFIPTLNVKWEKFEEQDTEAHHLTQSKRNSGGYVSSDHSSSDEEDVPRDVTVQTQNKVVKNAKSADSVKSTKTTETTATNGKSNGSVKGSASSIKDKKENSKLVLSHEELLRHQSGIIVFHVISGKLSKKARIEVLLDDGYWPCFSTMKARSTHAQFGYVGEGFMKEVDFGRVWFRLNDGAENEKDDIIAECKEDAKTFLQAAMNGPQTYILKDDMERNVSSVVVEARYIPVPVTLEPRESVNNQGILRVDLIDGREIRGVDRGGKSDPYVVFTLNGQKVFKSQTKKKTLTPDWNEGFEVSVPSRVAADFSLEVFDWNQIEQAKSLGSGKIDLNSIEPFEAREVVIPLVSGKHGEKGQVRLRLVFQPEIIAKTRKNTSTFSTAGRAMTTIGGLPMSAGKGVFHGVANVFKRGADNDDSDLATLPYNAAPGQATQPLNAAALVAEGPATATFPSSENLGTSAQAHEPGTLRLVVMNAKDLSIADGKPYAVVRVGDKEYRTKHTGKTNSPEWNESFTFAASLMTPKCYFWINDHKTLGKDKSIAEGEIDIWRHVQPEGISAAEATIELRPAGLFKLRLEFDASMHPTVSKSSASIHSIDNRRTSIASPSRFSIRGRRPNDDD